MSRDELMRPTADLNKSVLVVDDDPLVRDLLSRWLKSDGWQCVVAEDAEAALGALATAEPRIVVSDLNMPGHSGMWLLEQITERYAGISVLMLTASSDTKTAIEALMHGASGYLLKPIQREEFLFHVRQAREKQELIAERRQYLRTLEQRVHEQTVTIRLAHEETIHRLVTAAACRDEETGAHIKRTGLFSEMLALAAGWSVMDSEQLRMAAPMHDVGKIGIPDAILQKPGKLTEQEFERMKQHTTIGSQMLAGSSSAVLQLAEKVALSHHERWDGKGYPLGLAGEAIPEAARILSIVDVYDALSHDRVYRPAMPESEVLRLLQEGQGSQFDPTLLALFFSVFDDMRAIAEINPDVADAPKGDFGLAALAAICKVATPIATAL
jgi:putative two-component system response regulator